MRGLASSLELWMGTSPCTQAWFQRTCRVAAECAPALEGNRSRVCPMLMLRCLQVSQCPFYHFIASQRQENVDWESLAGQVPWSAYSDDNSKIKFKVRAHQLPLAAQNGLFVTWQLPWSLKISIKAALPSPLCIFFPFCNHVCLFFSKTGKETIIQGSYLNNRTNSFILMKKDY